MNRYDQETAIKKLSSLKTSSKDGKATLQIIGRHGRARKNQQENSSY
jgi:hypothetical protein